MLSPDLALELRAARPAAPPALRERVRAIAGSAPARRVTWRRVALVLVPICVVAAAGAALVHGLVTSGSKPATVAVSQAAKAPPRADRALGAATGQAPATLPTISGRLQRYESSLTLRVRDLSGTTKSALRLTRSLGGYVRSVDYSQGKRFGTADLVLRIPLGRVQEAIVRFSALGTIVAQRVSIRDFQPQADSGFRAMQALRARITSIQRALARPNLTAASKRQLERRLSQAQARLVALGQEQAQLARRAGFATVSLSLTTQKAPAAVTPHHRSRLDRAVGDAGSVLAREAVVVLYALIVGGPLVLLAALGLLVARAIRRRADARLLATRPR